MSQADSKSSPQSSSAANQVSDTAASKPGTSPAQGIPKGLDFLMGKNALLVADGSAVICRYKHTLDMLLLTVNQKRLGCHERHLGKWTFQWKCGVFP